jgi:hypothetical protein
MGHEKLDDGVESEVEGLPDVLALVRGQEEPVDRYVVVQVASWVEALALDTGQLAVGGLTGGELACLVKVRSEVGAVPSERHV